MNPSSCTPPAQLFGASMHAGGWPKLGWQEAEGADDADLADEDSDVLEG